MRARLLLEAFGVRAALLNAELPLNSRHHILQARTVCCCCCRWGTAGVLLLRLRLLLLRLPAPRVHPTGRPTSHPPLLPCSSPRSSQEFNRGLFDYLIATDDVHAADKSSGVGERSVRGGRGGRGGRGAGGKRPRKDEEFGVTRGIDFKGAFREL